ncbi:MAG: hypothetical protein A3J24_06150 [Deltaproteobacteria bacterium RIFCSPLOWO2_02_FULL_53_8]|nr:MAG: hypothetical protein A3J24_06150 [Deltaproteobacteria bacterium RIFCSPLOWO2_02_FULL_53_8]
MNELSEFYEWLLNEHKQKSGKPYKASSAKQYYRDMKREAGLIANIAKSLGFDKITDAKTVDQVRSILSRVEEHEENNKANNRHSCALKRYIEFKS